MHLRASFGLFLALLSAAIHGAGSPDDYLQFVRAQAAELRANDHTLQIRAWGQHETALRENLADAWGSFPKRHAPLRPQILGSLQREGYTVERLMFQTFPGVWMTANAYVPNKRGKLPAILMVHGHWSGAKQDRVVQGRCIGAAKLGFFVLAVDAFGAGERGVGKALGEYHGDMTAATLLPLGLPLSGLQVYENMRAVDYLRSRSEVDPKRIGITGASGGGNQTMYVAAWDKRFAAAVPVCSVGNYQAYLGAACCMCEVVPGALRFTEEWGVLSMVSPRALMVINATRDSRQFSVEEARTSLARALPIFSFHGREDNLRHVTFESGHDYSQPMREAVYGWMTLHLKGEGDGSPVAEPAHTTEDPETLRCFPGQSRPDNWMTIPKFAAAEGERILQATRRTRRNSEKQKERFVELLGGFPPRSDLQVEVTTLDGAQSRLMVFSPEPGLTLTAAQRVDSRADKLTIILDLERALKAADRGTPGAFFATNGSVITLDLRATGSLAWPSDKIGRAPDHTTAQWGLWIGRPLIGQWVWDIRRLLDALEQTDGALPATVELVGIGPAGLVAMAAAALDERITKAAAVGTLASYITDTPYTNQRMGILIPGALKEFGDIPELANLVAPKPLLIVGGVNGDGASMDAAALRAAYQPRQGLEIRLTPDGGSIQAFQESR